MDDRIEAGETCGPDGCDISSSGAAGAALNANAEPAARIDIVSDAICPWCYIGKRHLEAALAMLAQEGLRFSIHWNAFQLNPDMPQGGVERRAYRTAKFGSWERSQQLDARITQAAAGAGLEFHMEKLERTPNTVDAHRLILLASHVEPQTRPGFQDEMMEAVFIAYFVEGRDIGDHRVLADCAVSVGMERDAVLGFLASDQGREPVLRADAMARNAGVSGVPSFFLSGQGLFSGAVAPEAMADALRRAHKILAAQAA
jgi:predicted DsbA family dithiol-disulfide isomerase